LATWVNQALAALLAWWGGGGVASVVGRRRRCSGRGGDRVVDAPLLQTSSRYVLVLIRCPEI